jgi:hypothetical protein
VSKVNKDPLDILVLKGKKAPLGNRGLQAQRVMTVLKAQLAKMVQLD